MNCPHCCSTTTNQLATRTSPGYSTFRCSPCKRTFNKRTGTPFNYLKFQTEIVLLIVLWRLRYNQASSMRTRRDLTFQDVPAYNPFPSYIERLVLHKGMLGYGCDPSRLLVIPSTAPSRTSLQWSSKEFVPTCPYLTESTRLAIWAPTTSHMILNATSTCVHKANLYAAPPMSTLAERCNTCSLKAQCTPSNMGE
jgi:hypothetical protein